MRSTIEFKSFTIVLEVEAHRVRFEKWNGCLLLHMMSKNCKNVKPRGLLMNFVESVGVTEPSPKTSLGEQ
jgi:hypothetical protein